jgi:hypothetical protein
MLVTQALLWLIMGVIIGAFFHRWLASVGERHMRIVSIGLCDDPRAPHLHLKAVAVLDTAPVHENVTPQGPAMITISDPKPPRGWNELNWTFPLTKALRDDFATCFSLRMPGRHPERDYVAPFVMEHEGHHFIDIEMSRGGYTLHVYADANGVDQFVDELRVAKEQLLALPAARTETPPVEVDK